MSLSERMITVLRVIEKIVTEKKLHGELPLITTHEVKEALTKELNKELTDAMVSTYLTRLSAMGYLQKISHGTYGITIKAVEFLNNLK